MGNSRNFGFQVPALIAAGYRLIVIDSRGQGRSTMDDQPFSYTLMASDTRAVMDALEHRQSRDRRLERRRGDRPRHGERYPGPRSTGLFFFACNVDPSGTRPFVYTDVIGRCLERHKKDYAELSPTPDGFDAMAAGLQPMQKDQPNYSAADLAGIHVPVTVAQGETDEFITREHAEHIARSIPDAQLRILAGVSHFAPVQRPEVFNAAVLEFLGTLPVRS